MAFANFFVSEGELTKKFKGCYRKSERKPSPGDRGVLQGSWQPSPIPNIKPVEHKSIKGLYIFPGQTGDWTKMVGFQYGGPEGPVRVAGRAYGPPIKSLDSESVTHAWENAQYRDVPSSGYGLTIKNTSSKTSVDQCMKNAYKDNMSVFSVSNMESNNMAQCSAGEEVNTDDYLMIRKPENWWEEIFDGPYATGSISESECLRTENANTVYDILRDGPDESILGKTYLGKTVNKIDGPGPNVRGTIQGSWQPSPIPNIKPVEHTSIKGLFIFVGQTGDWTKMVGMQYGDSDEPYRVDGRAFRPPISSLDPQTVSEAWERSQDKGIGDSEYGLTITNEGGDSFTYSKGWEFKEYPSEMLELGTDYKEMKGFYGTIEESRYDLDGGKLARVYKTPEECKQICVNAGQDCAGFVYDTKEKYCSLKNKMYPDVSGKPMSIQDSYIRIPAVLNDDANGCPYGVKAVSSKFLVENGFISGNPMNVDFKCNDKREIIDEELDNIAELDSAYDTLSNEVKALETENSQILKGFDEVRNRFNRQVMAYDNTNKEIREIVENPTSQQLFEDMKNLSDTFSVRNTGLLMMFILFLIITLRVFRK